MAGILYIVATPIGNLDDMPPRVAATFGAADFVAAEDTRVTMRLLNYLGLKKPMVSYYEHALQKGEGILRRIEAGENCALCSDAGMPCVSDPGEVIVRDALARGIKVVPVPAASACVTALAVSGQDTSRWVFEGFLPVNRKQKKERLAELLGEKRTVIFYEAPHKLRTTLDDLVNAFGPERSITLCRELTKLHEEIWKTTLSTNYGDFLRSSVEKTKDQFSDEEYKTLTADAEKIRAIEEQIATLALADAAASGAAAQGTAFPQFEGSDLEGNPVDNSLFAGNAFTVVNFWFNGCKPCVEELDDLNALNEKVKAQGGEVVGINTETLDGSQQGIEAAKKLLAAKGASYRNIYFASGSDAGKFALNIMAFPTTYVFDRDGNVVGQPLLGGIDKEENLAALQKNIDAALAKDSAK